MSCQDAFKAQINTTLTLILIVMFYYSVVSALLNTDLVPPVACQGSQVNTWLLDLGPAPTTNIPYHKKMIMLQYH